MKLRIGTLFQIIFLKSAKSENKLLGNAGIEFFKLKILFGLSISLERTLTIKYLCCKYTIIKISLTIASQFLNVSKHMHTSFWLAAFKIITWN